MKRGEIAHHVTRGAFFLAIEKTAALLTGMLYFALMLRWLGPTNYGMLTLALAIAGLASIATGNLEVFLERFAAEYQARGRDDLLARSYALAVGIKFALGLLASAALLLLTPHLAVQFKMPELTVLVPILTFMVATDGLSTTGRSLLFGMQRYEWVSGISLLFHVGKTVLVGVLWWSRQGLVSLAIGLSALAVIQAFMFSIAAGVLARRASRSHAPTDAEVQARVGEPPLLRQMLGYCLPLLGARAAFLSGQNLGKVVLAKILDATQLGYFTFAFQTIERFVELVYTLPNSLLPSLTHLVAREERERLGYVFEQAFRLVQVAACVTAWSVFTFAPELTFWVGSPLFLPSMGMLHVLALVPIARTAQQPLTMLFQATRRPGMVFALAMLKLGVELACYLTIVPRMGGLGAAWANLAGAVASYLMALAFAGVILPETALARAGVVARALLLTLPLLAVSLMVTHQGHELLLGVSLRLALVPPAIVALFALGLITRYDLEKLSALELKSAAVRRVRDALVGAADRLARVFEPRRTA